MKDHKPYGLVSPYDNCPFRTDVKPFITAARVREIERGLVRSEFYCHKTTDMEAFDEEEDFYTANGTEQHCAGALILLEKIEEPSQMMRIAERIGLYDRTKLKMDAPVYDDFDEMFEAHRRSDPRRRRK